MSGIYHFSQVVIPSEITEELLALAKRIADMRHGGIVEDLRTLERKICDEHTEMCEEIGKLNPDPLDILAEMADVFYQSVKISAQSPSLEDGGATYAELMLGSLALSAQQWNFTAQDIWHAALAKMRLRATGIKDHDAERNAIAQAIA